MSGVASAQRALAKPLLVALDAEDARRQCEAHRGNGAPDAGAPEDRGAAAPLPGVRAPVALAMPRSSVRVPEARAAPGQVGTGSVTRRGTVLPVLPASRHGARQDSFLAAPAVALERSVLDLVPEACHMRRLGLEVPPGIEALRLVESRVASVHRRLCAVTQDWNSLALNTPPHLLGLLAPALRALRTAAQPGLSALSWASLNVDGFLHCLERVNTREGVWVGELGRDRLETTVARHRSGGHAHPAIPWHGWACMVFAARGVSGACDG